MKLSTKLKALRQDKGITQQQLADKVGVSKVAVHSWETGKKTPIVSHLRAICEVFRIGMRDLWD